MPIARLLQIRLERQRSLLQIIIRPTHLLESFPQFLSRHRIAHERQFVPVAARKLHLVRRRARDAAARAPLHLVVLFR